MSKTDNVKEKLAVLRIGLTAFVGVILGLVVYNLPTEINIVYVWSAGIILFVGLLVLSIKYKELLIELENLP